MIYDVVDFSQSYTNIIRKRYLNFSYILDDNNNPYKNNGLAIRKFYGNFNSFNLSKSITINFCIWLYQFGNYNDDGRGDDSVIRFPGNDNLRICYNYNNARAITLYKYVANDKAYGHPNKWLNKFNIYSVQIYNGQYNYYINGGYVTSVSGSMIKNFEINNNRYGTNDYSQKSALKWITLTETPYFSTVIPQYILYENNENLYSI